MVGFNNNPSSQPRRLVLAVVLLLSLAVLAYWQNGFIQMQPSHKVVLPTVQLTDESIGVFQADAVWQQLSFDADGLLVIDEKTEPALVPLVDLWLGEHSREFLLRIEYLLKKQFGVSAGEELISLVHKLSLYKQQERLWMAENSKVIPPPYQSLFALQDTHLGTVLAEQLYGQQRAMMRAMLEGFNANQRRQGSGSMLQPRPEEIQ